MRTPFADFAVPRLWITLFEQSANIGLVDYMLIWYRRNAQHLVTQKGGEFQTDNERIGLMPIPFTTENVNRAPQSHGVYQLFDGDITIYIGRATGKGVTIRSRLQDHKLGREGLCTQRATHYRREATSPPVARENELLEKFYNRYGQLPRCNDVMPLGATSCSQDGRQGPLNAAPAPASAPSLSKRNSRLPWGRSPKTQRR